MENKATSELLDLLWKIENKSGDKTDWDKYEEVLAELRKRAPFDKIIGNQQNEGFDPSLEEKMEDVLGDIKLLKRHKHDDKNGDVLVRI